MTRKLKEFISNLKVKPALLIAGNPKSRSREEKDAIISAARMSARSIDKTFINAIDAMNKPFATKGESNA
jgi:hypothetical protein